MSDWNTSSSYVWYTTSILGKGATATVYQGVHKTNGEPVAVKVFSKASYELRPAEVQMREFKVLQKLNHENIVKLLAVETEEDENRNKVLIMELCTGGNLLTILDEPQNSYGLEEEEFIRVLTHVSAGMRYLRDNKVTHRDLKPGNIMKLVKEDGRSIYMITDFGAARELEEDQPYHSFYGTEEYIHPDMYGRAILHRPYGKPFKATVDLWSIGVTLYHVATGALPFQPYGGKRNKVSMYYITTKKKSGMISGIQHIENGPIQWSSELPKSCLLNEGLRELVATLIAGIVECDDSTMFTFNQFFECVQDIISRKVFHIFYMNESKEIIIYMQPHKTLKDLKEQIACKVDVPFDNQLLLLNGKVFDAMISPTAQVFTYPSTSHSRPLILLHMEKTDVKMPTSPDALLPCFTVFNSNIINVDNDAALAKTCCSVAHAFKRRVEKLVRCRKLLLNTPETLLCLISENVRKLVSNLNTVVEPIVADLDKRFSRLESSVAIIVENLDSCSGTSICSLSKRLSKIVVERNEENHLINEMFSHLKSDIGNLEHKVLVSCDLQKLWDQTIGNCMEPKRCVERAESYVNGISTSWRILQRNRNLRVWTEPEKQFHVLEKVKVQQASKKLISLLQEECLKSCLEVSHKLNEWYSGMQVAMVQNKCLEDDLSTVVAALKGYSLSIREAEAEFDECIAEVVKTLKSPGNNSLQSDISELQTCWKNTFAAENNNKWKEALSSNNVISSDLMKRFSKLQKLQDELSNFVTDNDHMIKMLILESGKQS